MADQSFASAPMSMSSSTVRRLMAGLLAACEGMKR
jgi:hypothetical protein